LSRPATKPTWIAGQRDAVERTSALGFALRRKSSPAGWTYVGPFCRKGLRDLSRPATKPTWIAGQRDAVERTSALGFALRRKSSPAGWTYVGPFCRKGLRDLSRPATKPTWIAGQRDAVERTSALGFALRQFEKTSSATRTYRNRRPHPTCHQFCPNKSGSTPSKSFQTLNQLDSNEETWFDLVKSFRKSFRSEAGLMSSVTGVMSAAEIQMARLKSKEACRLPMSQHASVSFSAV